MSEPELPSVEHVLPRPRRIRRTLVGTILACIGLMVSAYFYEGYTARKRLEAAIAAADRMDPYWRLEDLEAHREKLPDDKNSAVVIAAVVPVLPGSWSKFVAGNDFQSRDDHSGRRLDEKQVRILRTELKASARALVAARKLKDLPKGRFPFPLGVTPVLSHVQEVRTIANLLSFDAMLRAEEKDLEGAMESCSALLNTARSIGDEPTYISALVRIAIRSIAIGRLELVLSQGEPSDQALETIQRAWEDEEQFSLLVAASRGERAFADKSIQALQEGNGGGGTSNGVTGNATLNRIIAFFQRGSLSANRAASLELHTEIIEIANLPEPERQGRWDRLKARSGRFPGLVRLTYPMTEKLVEADRRTRAQMRLIIVTLAAERYRKANGKWPESLSVLVPKYLKEVPTDPYDGARLRFRRVDGGVVVYSIGADRLDNGGTLGTGYAGSDVGVRLWDVNRRRQPPLPSQAP